MFLEVPKALSAEQVQRLRGLIGDRPFVSGAMTALGAAAMVKNNVQLPSESDEARAASRYLLERLGGHPLVQLAVLPRQFSEPRFSKYEAGMSYGYHIDSALLHGDHEDQARADIAMTLFLNRSDEYDGGELMVDVGTQTLSFKGDVGDCVIYTSSTFHRVAEVTKGVRLVAVLWAHSFVRHETEREILFDLGSALKILRSTDAAPACIEQIRKTYNNLLRLWAEV